ncbi:MAG TPA: YihY/virulence factor BrkB family protein [Thermoleophilaceae bacterium]|nr:YihY/virulence factor BrkB family protein [Thermoleophilaceae bacterium]
MSESQTTDRSTTTARAPESPTDLRGRSWFGVLKRTVKEFSNDNLTDWAAALTYYGVLAIFPALIALVSILGLVGHSATQPLINNLNTLAPGPGRQIFTNAITNMQKSQGAAGVLFFVGIGAAIWSASGYVGAFMRASNAIYEIEEGRPFYLKRPVQLLITVVTLILVAVSAVAVVVTGGLAKRVGDLVGVGNTAVKIWDIAKWPVLILVVAFIFSILYWAAPNVKQQRFRWLTPGGLLAVVVWIVASALFALYVANFSSYNKTYGALGGVIAFLVWLWISNIAVLLGAELNAELERGRQLEAGVPPRDTIAMEPRVEPKEN